MFELSETGRHLIQLQGDNNSVAIQNYLSHFPMEMRCLLVILKGLGGAEVLESAFLDTIRNLSDERVVLTLAGIERLLHVLPENPGHPVCASER